MINLSLATVFRDQVAKYGDRACIGYHTGDHWETMSWNDFGAKVAAVASGLIELGVGETQTVGIWSANRPEWSMVDFGALSIRAVPVPIYPTTTAQAAEYILGNAEVGVLFVGGQTQYDTAMVCTAASPQVRKIIVFDRGVKIDDDPRVMYFDDFMAMAARADHAAEAAERLGRAGQEDLATLIYTSGTTGEPKGVMLSHANFLYQGEAVRPRVPQEEGDISMCVLPLSHVFERAWTYNVFYRGLVNYYCEDTKKALQFMQEVKPNFICLVPRFYEKIYATVFHQLESASPTKRKLFNWALKTGKEAMNCRNEERPMSGGLKLRYALADKLVLSKIRALTGGQIKAFPCAGAPLAKDIHEFFHIVGINLLYGYGMTETSATVTCNAPTGITFGTTGRAVEGTEIRLGLNDELLIKGPGVMSGYYKKPEETAKTLVDGWLHTGDVAVIDEKGNLTITDRIKELMKTSNGKYVAPLPIETKINADHFVEQVVLIADLRNYVTALIVPSFEALEEWAKDNGINAYNRQELISHSKVVEFYEKRLAEVTKDCEHHEQVQKFTLLSEELSVEDGEITPTMKLKRRVINEKYKDVIDAMYQK